MATPLVPGVLLAIILSQAKFVLANEAQGGVEISPYQVQINEGYDFICSGTIISPLFILTAAQCVLAYTEKKFLTTSTDEGIKFPEVSDLKIIADGFKRTKFSHGKQERTVSKIYLHEEFDLSTYVNDIAILALNSPLDFNERIKSISYSRTPLNLTELVGTVTGWGKSELLWSAALFESLQKSEVRLLSKSDSQEQCGSIRGEFPDERICGIPISGNTCSGDIGGPMTCHPNKETNETILCGIMSNGPGCCFMSYCDSEFSFFKSLKFETYTDVSQYSKWIDDVIHQHTLTNRCKKSEFYCQEDKSCIPREKICDMKKDCSGRSDESKCFQLMEGAANPAIAKMFRSVVNVFTTNFDADNETTELFHCDNGLNIALKLVCNGESDCYDSSDEFKCIVAGKDGICELGRVSCQSDGRCIEKEWLCDGIIDCDDESDESHCDDNDVLLGLNSTDSVWKLF